MSSVATASGYARRLVELESSRTGMPVKTSVGLVARKVKASHNAVWSLLFRVPKSVTFDLYSALEAAVEREIVREIGALENELAGIRSGARRRPPGTIEEVEEGLARLREKLAGERRP